MSIIGMKTVFDAVKLGFIAIFEFKSRFHENIHSRAFRNDFMVA